MDYTTADYRPYDPTWRATHGYPPLAPGQNGLDAGAYGAPDPYSGTSGLPDTGFPSASRPSYPQQQLLGSSVVQQNPGIPFTPEQLARRRALIEAEAGSLDDSSRRPGAGKFPVASQSNIAIPISHRLNPSDISTDNFTLQGLLGVIGAGLGAGYLGDAGSAAGGIGGSSGELSYAADPLAGAAGGIGGSAGALPYAADPLAGATAGAAGPAGGIGDLSYAADPLAGASGSPASTDFFGNAGVDEFGNPTQSNFQGGPGTPGSGDFFNPGGTPGLPVAPPGTGSPAVPPGTQSALEKVFGKGIMAAIGNNPAMAAALAAGVMEKSNNPLTQPTIDAIKGAISSGQSIQGMQIPGITGSLQRAIDTANTNVGAWKPALDQASAFTSSGGAPITADDTARYMSPYIDQALAPAARKINEAAAAQRMTDAAKAGARGAFGTERNDQIAALTNRNQLMATGDLYGTGYANAFNTALNTAGADKSRALTAGGAFGNIATNTSALGAKDVEGLTGAGGIESLPFTEELTKQKTAGDVLSGAGSAASRAIGSTGQPSLLSNLTGAAGVLGAFDKLGNPTTPSTPSTPSIPGIGSLPSLPSISTPSVSTPAPTSNNPFDDSNSGVFGS